MKKLKNILSSLDISQERKDKLHSFFESCLKTQQFIYPQEISNSYGLNDNLVARLFVALSNEDFLEIYTVPYDRQTNYIATAYAHVGIVFKFEDELEVLKPDDGEPYDNASLEAIAAYRVIAI